MSGSGRVRISDVKTRRADFSERVHPASRSLGGTTLYAKSEGVLDGAIGMIEGAVLSVMGDHLILARQWLGKLVREKTGEDLDRSVLAAVVGRLLSLGKIENLVCLSVNSRMFSVMVRSDRLAEVAQHVAQVELLLRGNSTLSPREVQGACFPDRGWGTYYGSLFILSHLAYNGRAVFLDKELFAWPKEVEDALRKIVR
jgi:hypothetical protein